ncbi:DUF3822 family protein [Halosquirtibacter xylanolyticus]|uniref:DUF3822 family protein n=1 Tax=Halosquirtibacter xylanolyticus TaxID=3374599 RepID=UPI003749ED2E|nr:DUF3822 family protein [Prolixibacteraceae bacterium]
MKSNIYVDSSVSNEDFYRYERSIQVSLDGFSFSIVDVGGEKPRLVAYGFESIVATPVALLAVSLAHWLETLPFRNGDFKRNIVVVDLERSLVVPTSMFQKEDVSLYCDLHFPDFSHEWDSIIWNEVCQSNVGVLFAVPVSLLEVVKRYFEQFHLIHTQVLLLDEKQFKGPLRKPSLVASVRRRSMNVVLYDEKGCLLLCNRYDLRGGMDVPFYLFAALKQNNLNVKASSLCLMGEISLEDEEIMLLQSEFSSVDFYNGGLYIEQQEEVLDAPMFQYMPFLNVYRCEL